MSFSVPYTDHSVMEDPVGGMRPSSLELITDGFNKNNMIGRFQFGKVYRAVGEFSDLTVKVWDEADNCKIWPGDNEGRVQDEYHLTYDHRIVSHPNVAKFWGVSWPDARPTMVYKLQALDTVDNLLEKDCFTWIHRVKVAYGLASAIKCMHECKPIPYLIRNISAAHVMLDEEYNAKLYDFSMVSGGILADKRELLNQHVHGCHGYIDPDYVENGKWSEKCDVFAYGVLLICLISKRNVLEEHQKTTDELFPYDWAHAQYKGKKSGPILNRPKFSLVHRSLEAEPFFYMKDGVTLSKLAIQCVDYDPQFRPTMKQVVASLRKLSMVKSYAGLFGLKNPSTVKNIVFSGLPRLSVKKSRVYSRTKSIAEKTLRKIPKRGNNLILTRNVKLQCRVPSVLSYDDLKTCTDAFSKKNFIAIHQFGKLYHGTIENEKVTVKIFENVNTCTVWSGDNESRFRDELLVLQHPKFVSHPHIVKLMGYCYEDGRLGAVYDLQSLNCLVNLISDDDFTWGRRIKFAFELADLLKYLHSCSPPYLLRNLYPINILVDKAYNPKLFNFGMLTGGVLNDKKQYFNLHGLHWMYYTDRHSNIHEYYTEASDVYSYGMVLLNLITKLTCSKGDDDYEDWVRQEYKAAESKGRRALKDFSLADGSFFDETDFDVVDGQKITMLAMQCIYRNCYCRPSVDQVVKCLKKLKVMKTVMQY